MGTAENPHAGQGMVVLDIGGAIGALIVTAPASMEGVEIEIAPAGNRSDEPDEGGDWWEGEWHSHAHTHSHSHDGHGAHTHRAWPHVAVVGRPQGNEIAYAAVYPGLREGSYELWVIGTEVPIVAATVTGASVTQLDWPGAEG
jgi:hypothetical protein